jgi:UDP-N-acetylmuramoylalanine--D-glutamate ligase
MGLALLQQSETQHSTIVVGLGTTGLSCARFLAHQGMMVMVVDSRAEPPMLQELERELPAVETRCGGFDAELLKQAGLLVVSPGIPLSDPAIAAAIDSGVEVIGDIELFARHAKAPVVAITGSNGKSTVTTLLGAMARDAGRDVRVGGNIGTPALELLQETEPDLYILELSSFQLETTHSLKPAAAVVLNVSQDHLDRYAGIPEYAAAKQRIYQGAALKLINLDDAVVASWDGGDESWRRFTLGAPQRPDDFGLLAKDDQVWLVKGDELLLPVAELKLAGMHNVANALAALALGESVGLPMAAMLNTLRCFRGLPHRCQWLAQHDGVNWYNDSKATNVGAAVAAINGMAGRVVLLAGGEGKGQDFAPLREALAAKGRAAVLFGRDAELIAAALDHVVPVERVRSLNEAVRAARATAQPGDAVLLAPACASFDMFKGYEERGEQFAAAVQEVLS